MMHLGLKENVLPIVVIGVAPNDSDAVQTFYDSAFTAAEMAVLLRKIADDLEAGTGESRGELAAAIILD